MTPPTQPVEEALRKGILMYLRTQELTLANRPIKIDDTFDLEKLGTGQLPACLVYDPRLVDETHLSSDTVQFLAHVQLLLAVNRGFNESEDASNIAELRRVIVDTLRNSNGLGAEAFGIFSHSFEISEVDRYVSEFGLAKEYTLSVTGYYESTGQDKGSIYISAP